MLRCYKLIQNSCSTHLLLLRIRIWCISRLIRWCITPNMSFEFCEKNQRFDIYPEYLKMIYYTTFEKNLTTLVAMVAIKLEISMTRRHMKSTRHYPVHPPTPPCSHKGLVHGHQLSTPICPMPTGLPIPEIRVFQTLTLKLQRQGHGCGQRTRLYCQPII